MQDLKAKKPRTIEDLKDEFKNVPPIDRYMTKKQTLSKREAKQLEKEKQVIQMKYALHMKPADIAK